MKLKEKIANIQSNVGKMSKDKENPFFHSKYADLNQILDNINPLLESAKIRLIQPLTESAAGRPALLFRIDDLESEEFESYLIPLPDLQDPQKMGSCITYYRRYSVVSYFKLQTEEDDDGNKASGSNVTKVPYKNVATKNAEFEKNKKDYESGAPAF